MKEGSFGFPDGWMSVFGASDGLWAVAVVRSIQASITPSGNSETPFEMGGDDITKRRRAWIQRAVNSSSA